MDAPEPPLASHRRRWALPIAAAAVLAVAVVSFAAGVRRSGAGASCAGDPVDAGFATDMLDHHQQALQMALVAQDKATTTPVRALALRMIGAQQLESGRFMQYLEEQGLHEGDPDRTVMAWMGMPVPRAQMPGLVPPDQLVALTNATGGAVDRLFLDLMIRHHEGGVHMAEFAAEHGCQAPLRGVAGRMAVMQRREIADMRELRLGLG